MIIIDNEHYYTINELSQMFLVKPNTISSWRRNNKLKGLQLSERKFVFSQSDIKKMMYNYTSILPHIQKSKISCNIKLTKKEYTSKEVCNILHISNTTLLNWRTNNYIKFRKQSNKKIFYPKSEIERILSKGINNAQQHINFNEIPTYNDDEITKFINNWIFKFTFKILDSDKGKHNVFLNFSDVTETQLTPLVMINNNNELIDVMNNKLIISSKNIINYLNTLDKNKQEPLIDYSDTIRKGFEHYYLYTKNISTRIK